MHCEAPGGGQALQGYTLWAMSRPPASPHPSLPALPDAQRLDVLAWARQGERLAGRTPLRALPRLRDVVLPSAAEEVCEWQAQGLWRERAGAEPEVRLRLHGQACAALTCQRCLTPSNHTLQVQRQFRFVATEEEAERLDEAAGDDEDVLALNGRLNLLELLEDELILALPLVALHDTCPQLPEALQAPPHHEPPAQHPFAVLAQLKGKTPPQA